MKEIEVGEYVRTENGIIDKVDSLCGMIENTVYLKQQSLWFNADYIVKHSKELIDLVKPGDFVNGHRVKAVYLDGATKYIKLHNSYDNGFGIRTYNEDIKTILTKESYMANCYKVGGEDESN